jgi:acyl-coenzyme A synthetase/AMP-(fatty) acid ligase
MHKFIKSFPTHTSDKAMVSKPPNHVAILQLTNLFAGMTETSTTITMMPLYRDRGSVNSAGQLIPGVVAKVVKADGSLAEIGEQGELFVKQPSNALRYTNDEEA